ncbi:MAG TPA: kelch repeat-containing protein [Planctomycetota bacterium]|nr:kelch repeat-containing protein [Planctomycetota bacterium]
MSRFLFPAVLSLSLVIAATSPRAAEGWTLADDQNAGAREQHFLVWSPALKKALLLGGVAAENTPVKGAYVMAFDPAAKSWEALAADSPKFGRAEVTAATIDADGRNVFILAGAQVWKFSVDSKAWSAQGEPLKDFTLTAVTLACDPVNGGLVLLGAETALDRVGWMGGMFLSASDGKWQPLVFGDAAAREAHGQRRAARVALEEMVGRTRRAWYRDPKGEGSDAERKDLAERCAALKKLAGLGDMSGEVDKVAGFVAQKNLLDALKAARAFLRRFEEAMEAASPVPPTRRHSPVACDPVNKVLVLFGGDHEDYMTNDTWVLDLAKRQWRRANPKTAPSPRAGHGLVWLPKNRKLALWDGFRHNSKFGDYRGFQAELLPQRELWLYDVAADKWELAASWPNGEKSLPFQKGARGMGFFGYYAQPFPMALTADAEDRLVLVGGGTKAQDKAVLNGTWTLAVDAGRVDAAAAAKGGAPANSRAERTGPYLASFCEEPAPGAPTGLESLPANTWVQLPNSPRNPHSARWGCDFGTATWNPDAEEILHWGGGHCRTSSSVVGHWSPVSNRWALAYDMDEPYADNGGGPPPHSLLGRPWVSTHGYKCYGYDPGNKVMVLMRAWVGNTSRLYDPAAMRWLPEGPKQPFDGHDYTAQVIPTPQGAVAWAGTREYMGQAGRGLWILVRNGEWSWKELAKPGTAPGCRVDMSCSCYDSKRGRVLLMPGPEDGGAVYACSIKGGAVEKLSPANPGLGQVGFREAVYVEHCDWVLLAATVAQGGKSHHVVYDCDKNRWILLEAGPLAAKMSNRGIGLMYDAKRKLVYAMSEGGGTFALRIDPQTAKVVESPQDGGGK